MAEEGRANRKLAGLYVLAALILVLLAVSTYKQQDGFDVAWEKTALFFDPRAERAFTYGERHFDARTPGTYDVYSAEYFYREAFEMDNTFPLVRHELGRIAFLRGDFEKALELLNDELVVNPTPSPSTYYMRALVKGYQKDYRGAAADYERFFEITPASWGSINDYAWVLIKVGNPAAALAALDWGLKEWPENAWLLTNYATALYELGRYDDAQAAAAKARVAVEYVTVEDWLAAYPGNDPLIAPEGLRQFKRATGQNLARILAKGT